jgi:hypothetical protein
LLDVVRQDMRFREVGFEQVGDDMFSFNLHPYNSIIPVKLVKKEILQFTVLKQHVLAIADYVIK